MITPAVHPIEGAAGSLLHRLSEQTEDVMDECCADLWPGGDEEWWGSGIEPRQYESFSDHVYGATMRRFAELILAAAEAAEKRAGPRPVEWQERLAR